MPRELFRNKYRTDSARLKGWDYSSDGAYFITICTKDREEFFGDVKNGKMVLNEIGQVANEFWKSMPETFDNLIIDEFVVMPNHVHLILFLENPASVDTRHGVYLQKTPQINKFGGLVPNSVSSIINHYKGNVTKYTNEKNISFAWQSKFYDHIIRNEKSLNRIREYIQMNPENWENDRNNSENMFM